MNLLIGRNTPDFAKDTVYRFMKMVQVNRIRFTTCLIFTDVTLDENGIIRIYGKRWILEVFFKVCKSYLNLSKEYNSLSYDAMTEHTAVCFIGSIGEVRK